MRGEDQKRGARFSYVSPEQRVPGDHPLHGMRQLVDTTQNQVPRTSFFNKLLDRTAHGRRYFPTTIVRISPANGLPGVTE